LAGNLVDDPTIADASLLLRRIPAQRDVHIVWDNNLKRWRPSSQIFRNSRDNTLAISVNLKQVLDELNLPPESVLLDPTRYALASIPAALVRARHQVIQRNALDDDPSHAHVLGDKPKPVQTALAEACAWLIPPPGWPWPDKE